MSLREWQKRARREGRSINQRRAQAVSDYLRREEVINKVVRMFDAIIIERRRKNHD